MTTITLRKDTNILEKTNFQDEYELYEYLKEYLLVETLHKMDDEESSWAMNYDDSLQFLKSL